MTKSLGPARYAYFAHEVVEYRDDDHTPFNKRSGSCDSELVVQFRAPNHGEWVNFNVMETTTTKNYGHGRDTTKSRTISFNLTREQFAAVVAHVNRKTD